MPLRKKTLLAWILAGIAGLAVFIIYFNAAFPIASIEITLDRKDAFKKAEGFLKAQGFDVSGYEKAVMFMSDTTAATYLQKTQGLKRANELIRSEIPAHAWMVRYFKELQKEGFWVQVDPSTGKILRFEHPLLDEDKGADLTEDQARQSAEKVLLSQGVDLNSYELKDKNNVKEKFRTDYNFEWEKKNYRLKDAFLRVSVGIYGDKLGSYNEYLKVPEKFGREIKKEASGGTVLSMLSWIFSLMLGIAALVMFVIRFKYNFLWWKFGLFFGVLLAGLTVVTFVNSIPLLWFGYRDTVSKAVFMTLASGASLVGAVIAGLSVFLLGAAGESLSRDWPRIRMPLVEAFKKRQFPASEVLPVFIVGYALGFLFLGYQTLFYLIGTRFFSIWIPLDTEYSNILGTYMPFLFPLTVATGAAIGEEFFFRLFAIVFFKRFLRITWVAVVASSLIWAFGHSDYAVYPVYARGIELTLAAIAMGIVFLKYGIESVIIAHFVIDVLLMGMPLLRSKNPFFLASGVIVLLLALLPIPIMAWASKRNRRFLKKEESNA